MTDNLKTGAAVAGGVVFLWCALIVCCPICIILIVVCIVCKCIKDLAEEPEPRKDEEAIAGETSVPATVEMQEQPMQQQPMEAQPPMGEQIVYPPPQDFAQQPPQEYPADEPAGPTMDPNNMN